MMNAMKGRTLVLVDVENLLGGSDFTAEQVHALRTVVTASVSIPTDAHVTVATSAGGPLVEAGLGWPGARRVWRRGQDGADLALADVALNEDTTGRYQRVVICSGDGLFAVVARYLRAAGLQVTVLARPDALSRALASAAGDIAVLPTLGRAA